MRRYIAAAFGAFALLATMALTGGPAAAQTAIDTTKALGERALGDPKAPVTILDYSSMTCPHCARFHAETLPKIKSTYLDTGKARLVFRDFPFDQWALRASMMARCAPEVRYFPLLDMLFKEQAQWASAKDQAAALIQIGKRAGLSEDTIKACWEDKALADGILNSRLDGQNKDKVESTPTFILSSGSGTTKVEGAQPFEAFAAAIDKLAK